MGPAEPRKMSSKSFLLAHLLITTLLLAGCAGKAPPGPSGPTVEMKNFLFQPENVTVAQGTTVTWINRDTTYHTVTSDSGMELDSPNVQPGQKFTHTFDTPGKYAYHCKPHSSLVAGNYTGMVGTIIVTA